MTAVLAELLRDHAWLRDAALEVCAVGSTALCEACRRQGLPLPPEPYDVDLSWRPSPDEGAALLAERGIEVTATEGAIGRGTLGAKLGRLLPPREG